MNRIAVDLLLGFNRALDIFHSPPVSSPELLNAGLYPPLPVSGDVLIWGFSILDTARKKGLDTLSCLDLPGLTQAEMLALALALENKPGSYTWAEKEGMWQFLNQETGDTRQESGAENAGKTDHEYVRATQLLTAELVLKIEGRQDPSWAQKIAAFSRFPPGLKELVNEDQIVLKTALLTATLHEPVFLGLKKCRSLSFSRRRQFLIQLEEIGRKEALSGKEILTLAVAALSEEKPLEAVRRRRYPQLSQAEARFSLRLELLQGSGITLEPPPYFEGNSYSINFSFQSGPGLARKIHHLERLREQADELFSLLR